MACSFVLLYICLLLFCKGAVDRCQGSPTGSTLRYRCQDPPARYHPKLDRVTFILLYGRHTAPYSVF